MGRKSILLMCTMALILIFSASSLFAQESGTGAHQTHEQIFGKDAPKATPGVKTRGPEIMLNSANPMEDTGRVFFGYHPYWADGDEDQYRYDLMTHICYFRVGLNTDGSLLDDKGWKTRTGFLNLKANCQQFGITLVLGITKFGDASIATFLDDPTAQSTGIANLLAEVQAGGVDGINIDFEFVPTTHAAKFTTFMQNLANAFRASDPTYHISLAAKATPSSGLEEKELSEICDHIFMMNYNYHWSGGNPGPCSTLESSSVWGASSVLDTIRDHIKDGVAPEKLVAGIAWYGMEWPCNSRDAGATSTGSSSTYFYETFLTSKWPAYGKKWHWPSDSSFYAYYSGGDWHQGWCEDHIAWKRRCEMIERTGIAGVGCWALGYCSTSTAMYPRLWQGLQECFLDGPDYSLDNFELWDINWKDPNSSGSTSGDTDNDSTFSQSTAQVHGTGSTYSAKLFYDFESATGFIREYYSASGEEGRGFFGPNTTLSIWIYGDNSNNQFRFAVRDEDNEIEVSDYTTINWTGWQKVEWDLGNDNINAFAGDGILDGWDLKIESLQLSYPGGANNSGTIYFDDFCYTVGEEVVTVGSTGDYTDIQTAVDSFTGDNPDANVVELIDNSYTIASQLVLQNVNNASGTLKLRAAAGKNPILVCAHNDGDAAILAKLDGDVEIGSDNQTITIIPSTSSGTGDNNTVAVRADEGSVKINAMLKNILIAPNNGSGAADSIGKSAPTGGSTQFGGGFQLYSGPGFDYYNNAWLYDVTITGTGGGTSGTSDAVEFYGDGDIGGWVGPGCRFSYNAGNGVYCNKKHSEFLGTRAKPILIHNNGIDGIQVASDSRIYEIYHTAVVENGGCGLNVISTNTWSDFRAERSCFAQNTSTNVNLSDASFLNITFDQCTFHDAGGSSDDISINAAAVDTDVILNDCIVTGNGTSSPSDTLNISNSSTNGTITCNYTGIILNGPDALLAPDGLYGKKASVTQNNSFNGDPMYISETFNNGDNADYLDVNSYHFNSKATGGEDLSGYGDFIGGWVPVELSTFSID
jgi:spore germination protein YaaH